MLSQKRNSWVEAKEIVCKSQEIPITFNEYDVRSGYYRNYSNRTVEN